MRDRETRQEMRHILCVNSGSSSLKFRAYRIGQATETLARGAVEDIGQDDGRLWLADGAGGRLHDKPLGSVGHGEAVEEAMAALAGKGLPPLDAVGHRVVHGGPLHVAPELITQRLIDDLHDLVPWARLHLPAGLGVMESVIAHHPDLPQVACFDTAFHARMPEVAKRLPLPGRLFEEGIHRYGFHGLSYEYVLHLLQDEGRGRLIIAHLGNGASMAACLDGKPVDTTMGMTPLGGFMMGTRPGDLDPGVLLYLLRERGYELDRLERMLDKESGLKGVSGTTSDMQTLLELRSGDPRAALAVDMFCYQARKTVGGLAAVLGGLDVLVFTGGIGEHAAPVRAGICEGLRHLGIAIDPQKNQGNAPLISSKGSGCTVRVVHTSEELVIARQTYELLFGRKEERGGQ